MEKINDLFHGVDAIEMIVSMTLGELPNVVFLLFECIFTYVWHFILRSQCRHKLELIVHIITIHALLCPKYAQL